jgi:Tol biopolymer transport system component
VLEDGSVRRLDFAHEAMFPAVSPRDDKLAYSGSSENVNIWRQDLFRPEAPAVKLISSTRSQDDAQYSPDGRHIAFQSNRGGRTEIWMSDSDGGNVVQL